MNSDLPHQPPARQFASDNYAGICPEAWEAMAQANAGHASSYGDDPWTAKAADLLRDLFETDCEVFFTFNGTAANALALATLCRPYQSIICHEAAHIATDECGAPEFFTSGCKLLTSVGDSGRLNPAAVSTLATKRTDLHFQQARALSVTQATELGSLYTVAQLSELQQVAQTHQLATHMDGARFANAVAALQVSPKALSWQVGVEVLCFGGTKNGMGVGDAILFFNRDLAKEFAYRCKQAGQLASKMRYLAAPWVGLLQSGAWLRNAAHANQMAQILEQKLREIPGVRLLTQRQINSVFVHFPPAIADQLRQRGWKFYNFIGATGARLMCSWDTQLGDIEALTADIAQLFALPELVGEELPAELPPLSPSR